MALQIAGVGPFMARVIDEYLANPDPSSWNPAERTVPRVPSAPSRDSPFDVSSWLASIGLSCYTQSFVSLGTHYRLGFSHFKPRLHNSYECQALDRGGLRSSERNAARPQAGPSQCRSAAGRWRWYARSPATRALSLCPRARTRWPVPSSTAWPCPNNFHIRRNTLFPLCSLSIS